MYFYQGGKSGLYVSAIRWRYVRYVRYTRYGGDTYDTYDPLAIRRYRQSRDPAIPRSAFSPLIFTLLPDTTINAVATNVNFTIDVIIQAKLELTITVTLMIYYITFAASVK